MIIMKKTLFLLLVLCGLGALYYTSIKESEEKSTIKMEDRQFLTLDRDEVHIITIDSPGRPLIHLSRSGSDWYVDQKHKVRPNIIDNMFLALMRMTIKYIPLKKENDTAAERMKMFGLEIKTYDKSGQVLTDFTLGTNTNDEYGTYFRNRGAEQTYVMSIPSYDGGLRNYFTQNVAALRDLAVLSEDAENIKAISVDYPKDVARSMVLSKTGSQYELSSNQDKEVQPDQKIADAFFKSFRNVYSEEIMNNYIHKDTISRMVPFLKLSLDMEKGQDKWIALHPIVDIESGYNTRRIEDVTTRHSKYFVSTSWGDFYKVQNKFLRDFFVTPEYFIQK